MGLGSGAALLEIEELCEELAGLDESDGPVVLTGVCTLQCANAPVVNVYGLALPLRHHSKVDAPARCATVVAEAAAARAGAASPPRPTTKGPMLRRAEGLRWAALRQQARRPREQHCEPSRQLELALQAEARAVAADPALRARAERRAARLTLRCERACCQV